MLFESCCFLLHYHREQIKTKRKKVRMSKIFQKRIKQGVYRNLLQEIRVNDSELYFRLFV